MSDATSAAPSAGALLRAAREKQGLHIAALAAAIKVTPRKLDALENDRWNELPDATFTRALAQTVCRSLKIDPKSVLDLLPPAEVMPMESGANALNEPFSEGSGRAGPGLAGAAIKPMVVAALVLLLAALTIYFVPASWWPSGAPPSAPAPVVVVPLPALPSSAAEAAAPVAAEPAPTVPAVVTSPAPVAASAPRSETVFASPAASSPAMGGLIQLRTREPSWVEVRDSGGRVLISRTVLPGEGIGLDGEAPFRLVIGNAAATEVTFRGQPVDLLAVTRDSVARLELK
jgi:cytoskeleton protein RodZ